jgi:RNA polymerase sigma-70 factor (ECF subfamily)
VRGVLARLAGPSLAADDLLQEVFVIALDRLPRFGESGPPLPWLFGVAARVAVAARRRQAARRFFGLEEADEPASPHTPHSDFERQESAAQVYAALEPMDERKRTVFVLYELEGLQGEEIAAALQIPLTTVWTRLGRARTEFAERLRRDRDRAQEKEDLAHGRS